jgi:exosortase A
VSVSSSVADPPPTAARGDVWQVGLAAAALLVAFWPTVLSMHGTWTRITYSHGYLVAPVVLWLAWRRRRALVTAAGGAGVVLVPIALLSLVWLAAVATNVQVIHQALLPVIGMLWVAAVGGWGAARRLLPAAVVFLFAVPFWEILTRPLQLMTIAVNGLGVRILGIPAEIAGEYIRIPSGTFRVADSCSGLRFFIVAFLLGTLYAHLFESRWRTRFQIVAAAIGLALISNWIRVLGLVVIGHATEMQWEHLEDHGFYGWVVFAVVFSLFFPLASFLQKRGGSRRRPEETPPGGGGLAAGAVPPDRWEEEREAAGSGAASGQSWTGGDGDEAATPQEAPSRLLSGLRGRLLLATALAVLGPVTYGLLRAAPASGAGEGGAMASPESGVWTVGPPPQGPPLGWEPDFPEPDRREAVTWTDGSAELYGLTLWYGSQRQGQEVVNAENRLTSEGRIAADDLLWLSDPDVWVRQAFVQTETGVVVVWYWYRIGGVKAVSPAKAKALELWGFLRRRPSATLVTVSAACESENCREEQTALRAFVSGITTEEMKASMAAASGPGGRPSAAAGGPGAD